MLFPLGPSLLGPGADSPLQVPAEAVGLFG